jgi:glutamyl-Q tRNA(Asp) synthetase
MPGRAWAERLAARVSAGWRTRFAPAPTGWLHLGHAVNAVVVWGLARALDGRVLLRLEDHDAGRCRPAYADGILDCLDWLGLDADLAPVASYRAGPSLRQSARGARYAQVLAALRDAGSVYACRCSRREIAAQRPADAAPEAELWYPGTCRDAALAEAGCGIRVRLDDRAIAFDDVILGPQRQVPAAQCGDLLVRERSGSWTYQFAVTVDDLDQGIDVVLRGEDLLASTGRQWQLRSLLGAPGVPVVGHHPLLRQPDGRKLSKSDGATGLDALRADGWTAARVLGTAAHLAGLCDAPRPLPASALSTLFGG